MFYLFSGLKVLKEKNPCFEYFILFFSQYFFKKNQGCIEAFEEKFEKFTGNKWYFQFLRFHRNTYSYLYSEFDLTGQIEIDSRRSPASTTWSNCTQTQFESYRLPLFFFMFFSFSFSFRSDDGIDDAEAAGKNSFEYLKYIYWIMIYLSKCQAT